MEASTEKRGGKGRKEKGTVGKRIETYHTMPQQLIPIPLLKRPSSLELSLHGLDPHIGIGWILVKRSCAVIDVEVAKFEQSIPDGYGACPAQS